MKLRDLPLSTVIRDERHSETINHYVTCTNCRPLGIAQIKRAKISCPDAVTTCLRGDGMLHDETRCDTLQELLAHEHVFGTARATACEHAVCSSIREFWANQNGVVPNAEKLARAVEHVIDSAMRKSWPIETLHEALKDRQRTLENMARSSAKAIAHFYRLEMMYIDEALAKYD